MTFKNVVVGKCDISNKLLKWEDTSFKEKEKRERERKKKTMRP
jgi:hypothetical protein